MAVPPDLTFRSPDGTPYTEPLASGRFFTERECRIILIHGFRNNEAEALESYDLFRSYFCFYPSVYSMKLYFMVWPGDQLGALRFFDKNVQAAGLTGRAFARYLDDQIVREQSNCRYVVIAHSLGCRVAAEMISELLRRNPNACGKFRLFLMAGAVPTADVDDAGTLGAGLLAADYVANLYSPDDKVLRLLFPLGELGVGRSSTAIGLYGEPSYFRWTRERMNGFGHSDYWRTSLAAEFVARVLGVPVPQRSPEHHVEARQPAEYVALENELPAAKLPTGMVQ